MCCWAIAVKPDKGAAAAAMPCCVDQPCGHCSFGVRIGLMETWCHSGLIRSQAPTQCQWPIHEIKRQMVSGLPVAASLIIHISCEAEKEHTGTAQPPRACLSDNCTPALRAARQGMAVVLLLSIAMLRSSAVAASQEFEQHQHDDDQKSQKQRMLLSRFWPAASLCAHCQCDLPTAIFPNL